MHPDDQRLAGDLAWRVDDGELTEQDLLECKAQLEEIRTLPEIGSDCLNSRSTG